MPRSFLVKRRKLYCETPGLTAESDDFNGHMAFHEVVHQCKSCCPQISIPNKLSHQLHPSAESAFYLCQSPACGEPVPRNGFVTTRLPQPCTAGSCCNRLPRFCPCEDCARSCRPVLSPPHVASPARLFFPTNVQFCCNGISCNNSPLRREIRHQPSHGVEFAPCRRPFSSRDFIPKSPLVERETDKIYDLNNNLKCEIPQRHTPPKIIPRKQRIIVLKDDRNPASKPKVDELVEEKRETPRKEEQSPTACSVTESDRSPSYHENDEEPVSNTEIEEMDGTDSKEQESNVTKDVTKTVAVWPDAPNEAFNSVDSCLTEKHEVKLKIKSEAKTRSDCTGKRRRYNTRTSAPQSRVFNDDFVTPGPEVDWAKGKGSPRGRYRSKLNRLLANEHERRRVAQLNLGYQKLRKAIPGYQCDTKLPKIKILRYAIAYIDKLDVLLGTDTMQLQPSLQDYETIKMPSSNKRPLSN